MTTNSGHSFYGVVVNPDDSETAIDNVLGSRGGLRGIPGFSRSVRTFAGKSGSVDLNINTSTACFWHGGTVQELIEAWRGSRPSQNPNLNLLDAFLKEAPVRTTLRW